MKKSNLQTILTGFLLVASFCCYIFLNTVTITPSRISATESELKNEQEEESSTDIYMPDIELVKKVLSNTKAIMHAAY